MEERTGIREEIKQIKELIEEKEQKTKKFKLPFKSRVSKGKLKKGFVTVQVINENKGIDFTRVPIEDGTIKVGDTLHALEEKDILYYKGKPFVIQPKDKINPYNPVEQQNQIYGEAYLLAKMEKESIKKTPRVSGMMIFWFVVIAIGVIYWFSR